MVEAVTFLGRIEEARNAVKYLLGFQRDDGAVMIIDGHLKETGIALWTATRHARLTGASSVVHTLIVRRGDNPSRIPRSASRAWPDHSQRLVVARLMGPKQPCAGTARLAPPKGAGPCFRLAR